MRNLRYDLMKSLWMIQERDNGKKKPFDYTYVRLNPYNPLVYVYLAIVIPIYVILYGVDQAIEDIRKLFSYT